MSILAKGSQLKINRDIMSYTVRVLYDFEADNTEELSVTEGDILTVTDPDTGDGWITASHQDGRQVKVFRMSNLVFSMNMYRDLSQKIM